MTKHEARVYSRTFGVMHKELTDWLDQQTITSDNIGEIRRRLFMPWSSPWNAIVRDETAARERKP